MATAALLLLLLLARAPPTPARPQNQPYVDDEVQRKLMQFGYLPQSNIETGELRLETDFIKAIKLYQEFGGLEPTGVVDAATRKLLQTPRCGLPDVVGADRGFRSKRYTVQGQKWSNLTVTWALRKMPQRELRHKQASDLLQELRWAFDVWQKNSKLKFIEIHPDDRTPVDMEIGFVERDHRDNYAFDGKGGVLAHAFFPGTGIGGDVHFDDQELWTLSRDRDGLKNRDGTSLFFVAAHEIGHALGLSHSSVRESLMFAYYTGDTNVDPNSFTLHNDDRNGIQQIYGVINSWGLLPPDLYPTRPPIRPEQPPTKRPPTTKKPLRPEHQPTPKPAPKPRPEKPDTCDTSYDAITVFRVTEVWIFKDKYMWRVHKDTGVMLENPTLIAPMLKRLCHKNIERVDAIYERPSDGSLVIFHGKKYYVCNTDPKVTQVREHSLTSLGLPDTVEKVDAAFTWGHNGRTYLFSGTSYWRLDEDTGKAELDYPRDMSMWSGVGYNIDAAFKWTDGRIYFFKGKSYWKFNDMNMKVDHEKPMLSAPFWMGCPRRFEDPLQASTKTASGGGRAAIMLLWPLLIALATRFV